MSTSHNSIPPSSAWETVDTILMLIIGALSGIVFTLTAVWVWQDIQLSGLTLGGFLASEASLMGLPLAADTPAYWYMARAGGIISYLLLWLSTVWGIFMSSKVMKGILNAGQMLGMHQFLSILAIIFSLIHAIVLLGDSYISFNLIHLLIPFTSPYEPFWTGLGSIAFYLILALTGSFYIRQHIGQKVWRAFHYSAFLAYFLAMGHGIMAGSDSGLLSTQLMYLITAGSTLFFTYYRILAHKPKRRRVKAA